jgi:two-component system LytT family response regulator
MLPTTLQIATSQGFYYFNPDEIIRLEASSNYTYLYFTNRKPMLVAKVLSDYETILGQAGFVRTHRSHLVNRKHVLFLDRSGNIIMKDASKAEVSRRKRKVVMDALGNNFYTNAVAA